MKIATAIGLDDSAFDLPPINTHRVHELELNEAVDNITSGLDDLDQDYKTIEGLSRDLGDINQDYINVIERGDANALATQIGLSSLRSKINRFGTTYGINVGVVTNSISMENINANNIGLGLEAVNGMIGDVVRGIKEFIANTWEKFQDFWKRNFAEMTRVYKALVRIKKDIVARNGDIPSEIGKMDSPVKFVKVIAPEGDISPKLINACVQKQAGMSKDMGKFTESAMLAMEHASKSKPDDLEGINKVFDTLIEQFRDLQKNNDSSIVFGDDESPLSKFATAKIEFNMEDGEHRKKFKVKFVTGRAPYPDDDRFLVFGNKQELLNLVSSCEGLYTITDRLGKGIEKQDRRFKSLFDKASKNIDRDPKEVEGEDSNVLKEAKANAKFIADIYSQFAGVLPKMSSFMIRMNLDLIKVVIHYINTCLDKFQYSK